MPDFEAIGDAVTGGVIGGAVEPRAGVAADGHTHERNCLNCGTPLTGDYCFHCGQRAHVHRTLTAFWHDLVHGAFHFEGKIWHTLPLLVWKPGELTRRYIDGQRARFVSPIALFLFCVFLTFASVSLLGGHLGVPEEAKKDLQREIQTDEAKLQSLQGQLAAAQKAGQPTRVLENKITEVRREITAASAVQGGDLGKAEVVQAEGIPDWAGGWLGDAVEGARENPELVFYKIKTNAYKFSWALIPISVPFVWLLFPFSRRFRLYDHTVFVTYSLSFMMLLLITGTVVGLVSEAIASFAWFVPPIHMYRQLRGTYGVGRWGAFWRTMALTIFAFIAISLFVTLLVTIGALD